MCVRQKPKKTNVLLQRMEPAGGRSALLPSLDETFLIFFGKIIISDDVTEGRDFLRYMTFKNTFPSSHRRSVSGNLQRGLPPLLHVEVSSLDTLVFGKVHPFGEVFFEVRPHRLVGGLALQMGHSRGESTHSTGGSGNV